MMNNNNYECVTLAKSFMNNVGYNYLWQVLGTNHDPEIIRQELEAWCFTIASENVALATGLWGILASGTFVEDYISIQWMMPATVDACEFLAYEPPFLRLTLDWVGPEEDGYYHIIG